MVRLTDHPDLTIAVYHGRKARDTVANNNIQVYLTQLHSKQPNLPRVLSFLSAVGLIKDNKLSVKYFYVMFYVM